MLFYNSLSCAPFLNCSIPTHVLLADCLLTSFHDYKMHSLLFKHISLQLIKFSSWLPFQTFIILVFLSLFLCSPDWMVVLQGLTLELIPPFSPKSSLFNAHLPFAPLLAYRHKFNDWANHPWWLIAVKNTTLICFTQDLASCPILIACLYMPIPTMKNWSETSNKSVPSLLY